MPASRANLDFAALVEGGHENVHFEPLSTPEVIETFHALSAVEDVKVEKFELNPETYQRVPSPLPEYPSGLQSQLAEKEHEIEQLRALLSLRDVALEEAKVRMEQETSQMKFMHDERLSRYILDGLSAIEVRVSDELGQAVSSILQPFVLSQLRQRILDEFTAVIGKCLTGGGLTKIRISGPADMIAALRHSFDGRLAGCELSEAETIDISAEMNNKLVSTRLEYWSTILAGR